MIGVTIASLLSMPAFLFFFFFIRSIMIVPFIIGVVMGFFGIVYREFSINRDFEKPEGLEYSIWGLLRSLLIRVMQFLPIGLWVAIAGSTVLTTPYLWGSLIIILHVVFAVVLTEYEHKRWVSLKRPQ